MKCRKAFELDLADFVVDPSADAWAAFRTHYPECADCAAEVAVWDEMQAFLRSGGPGATTAHPPKELLLRYEEQRATLSAIEVAMVGKHLATCRTCPDELAALRTFDFSVVRCQPAPQPWWALVRDAVARIRPVVLHPAFAYALVLFLLYPALIQLRLAGRSRPAEQIALESPRQATVAYERIITNGDRPEIVSPPPSADPIAGAPPDAGAAPRAPRPLRADDPATRTVAREATQPNSQLAAASKPAASRHAKPAGSAAGDSGPTDHPANDAPAAKASSAADHDEDTSDAVVHGEPADTDSDEPRVLGLAETEEPHDGVRHARQTAKGAGATHEDAGSDASWQTIVLAPDRTPAVQRRDVATGVILRVPPADRDVEIRIVGPSGREAAREMVQSRSGPIEVRIRATELVDGTYRVLTRRLDGSASSEQTSELRFIVR